MRVMRLQGWYYLRTAAWPLLHERSFEAVAGPKPDKFQTQVTSALFMAAGVALLSGTRARSLDSTAKALAAASGLGVAAIEWRHRHTIRPIFQVEAAVELGFVAAVLAHRPRSARSTKCDPPKG